MRKTGCDAWYLAENHNHKTRVNGSYETKPTCMNILLEYTMEYTKPAWGRNVEYTKWRAEHSEPSSNATTENS